MSAVVLSLDAFLEAAGMTVLGRGPSYFGGCGPLVFEDMIVGGWAGTDEPTFLKIEHDTLKSMFGAGR